MPLGPTTQTAKHVLAFSQLMHCALLYIEYFQAEEVLHKMVKYETKKIENSIKSFNRALLNEFPADERHKFIKTWEQDDFASASRILDIFVDLSTEKRDTLEFCAKEILAGNFKIEIE